MAENGVACCDCSCGNIAMMEWVMRYLNPDLLARVKEKLYAATENSAFAPSSVDPPLMSPQTRIQENLIQGHPQPGELRHQGVALEYPLMEELWVQGLPLLPQHHQGLRQRRPRRSVRPAHHRVPVPECQSMP